MLVEPFAGRSITIVYARIVSEKFSKVIEFPAGTRTASDAAAAIGCDVAQIVKSLVFRDAQDGSAVLVLCSGSNTVDADRLGLIRAAAGFVRDVTGYAIGGVPPWGWTTSPARTLVDHDLLAFEEIWAAAGTPKSVFSLSPTELLERTAGEVQDIAPRF
jgi:prolyl-tRNA editing enzyme YbaK/EbsC (Cys-tRNA(Pro) deacylase)